MMINKRIPKMLLRKKKRSNSDDENKDSNRERIIVIYLDNIRIIFKVELIMDLYFILQNLNLPYFYYKEQKIYFNYDKDIFFFWDNKNNKIIYDSKPNLFINEETFYAFHMNIKKENVNKYSDFCSPYYYFYDSEEKENEIQKENKIEEENDDKIDDSEKFINTLNENTIIELKHTRYLKEKKIIRIFGPKKNGKSTLIYYYFGMRRYIPITEQKLIDDFINKEIKYKKKDNNHKIDTNNIDKCINYLEETEKIFEDSIHFIKEEYNKELKREEKLEASNDIPCYNNNYDNILKTFSLAKNNDKKFDITLHKNNQNTIFQKEFNITRNDLIGFFRSCYLNNDFFKSNVFSNENKEKTLFYEFEGLFKSYNIYKFFITKFISFYDHSKSIIQIAYFVLNFMMKYNKSNARYFIILDSLSNDLFKELEKFENDARKDNNCFIIEIYKNEKIENIFYNNIISPKFEDDILKYILSRNTNPRGKFKILKDIIIEYL